MWKRWLSDVRCAYAMDCHCCPGLDEETGEEVYETRPFWRYALEQALVELKFKVMWVVCYFRGHRVELIDSWASPDTGGEDFACTRCGMGWRTIYY